MYSSLMSKNTCISGISCAIITVPYKCNNHKALEISPKNPSKCPQHVATEFFFNKEELLEIEDTKENAYLRKYIEIFVSVQF